LNNLAISVNTAHTQYDSNFVKIYEFMN
jgi:hypothetical protein